MTERSRRVVLLIDYDNLQICAARDTPGRDLQLAPVVQLAQRYGTVILARAYAEWNLSTERLAVYKAGIEPAFAPVLRTESDRSGKSLADTVMVAEGMDMLWTLSPEVVVLATSDKDLIPLARVAKQRGAFVVVLGSDFTAIPLREMADEHVTYRQLISDAGGRHATEAGPGRQPAALPEPSRRRRDRDGRDRGAAPAPAVARPEREATPAPQPAATPSAAGATPAAEPVAPFTAGAPGEADGQTSGRRRRRRGSRRRSDRLGLSVEDLSTEPSAEDAEAADGAGVEGAEDLTAVPEAGITTPGTPDVSGGGRAAEAAEADAVAEGVEIEGAPAVAEVAEPMPEVTATEAPVEQTPVEETPAEAAAVARERRPRRTRRRVTDTPTAEPAAVDEPVPPSEFTEPAPPPEEAARNGASPVEGAPEPPAEPPARRPRRVASATRGRSRRP